MESEFTFSNSVVVLAYEGTEQKMQEIWQKFFRGHLCVWTLFPGTTLTSILEQAIADDMVGQRFVLVPANLIPVAPTSFVELSTPVIEASALGKMAWGHVPVAFDKEALVEFLPDQEHDGSEDYDEKLVRTYLDRYAARPHLVGHSFGNYLLKVLRGDPCEHRVIAAFVEKHFVYANNAGWAAVAALADKLLLK